MVAPTSGGVRQHPYSNGATRTVSAGGGGVVTDSPGDRRSAARRQRVPVHLANDPTSGGRPASSKRFWRLRFVTGDEIGCGTTATPISGNIRQLAEGGDYFQCSGSGPHQVLTPELQPQ